MLCVIIVESCQNDGTSMGILVQEAQWNPTDLTKKGPQRHIMAKLSKAQDRTLKMSRVNCQVTYKESPLDQQQMSQQKPTSKERIEQYIHRPEGKTHANQETSPSKAALQK